jgi:hypothetical protein
LEKKVSKSTLYILGVIIFVVAVIVGAPIALIWALNTLFPVLNIPFTLETWLAAFIIPAAFKSEVTFRGKK